LERRRARGTTNILLSKTTSTTPSMNTA